MKTLYTIKDLKGAHYVEEYRPIYPNASDTPSHYVAVVRLVGAIAHFVVNPDDLTPFTLADRATFDDWVVNLAQEAATLYNLDPQRVQRAAEIVRSSRTAVQMAKRDEFGEPIAQPSYKKMIVKGSKSGWYVVTRGSCTCKDHANGHTCKHRIAAWIKKESIIRPIAALGHKSIIELRQELEN